MATNKFRQDQIKVLYSKGQLAERIKVVAQDVNKIVGTKEDTIFICVLKGGFMFFTDFIKEFQQDNIMTDFITVSSYKGTKTEGEVTLVKGIASDVQGKHVVIVEDIVDSGHTLKFLKGYFEAHNCSKVTTVCLLDKPSGREIPMEVDYSVFVMEDSKFVVGYGLDYDQRYRNIDHICYIEQDK